MDPIQNQPVQQFPQQKPSSPVTQMPEHKKVGPMLAILVVVLVLIIGALYLFASRMTPPIDNTSNDTAMVQTTVKPVTSTSENINDLEADLNASIEGLDSQNF